jgi:hypothetical protein
MNKLSLSLIASVAGLTAMAHPVGGAIAAEEKPVGYGGAKVQMAPIMSPYRVGNTVRYQVVTVRLVLDVGLNERPSCFMVPVVHEKFLMYFYKTQPVPEDFKGQRLDVMQKNLLDIATATTDRGFYAGVEVVDDTAPALDPKSQTLSTQCR